MDNDTCCWYRRSGYASHDVYCPSHFIVSKVEPKATAVFRRLDGKTFRIEDVDPDSIGPSAANPGVIAVEYADHGDTVTHLPFIESWEIEYTFD